MSLIRRALLGLGAFAALAAAQASAQTYPSRPVKIIVSFAPGGIADTTGRLIAQGLSTAFDKPVVVENRPGAGAIVGIALVAKAAPDGYTLLLANTNVSTNPALYAQLPYDADRELIPVANAVVTPAVLVVHPSVPVTNIHEFLELARAKPGQIDYASVGVGSFPHLAMEMLDQMADLKLVHVPYKGFAPAVTAVMAGEVQVLASDVPTALPNIQAGKLKALAATGTRRFAVLPDVPTLAEKEIPGYEAVGWLGIMAPAGTPREIVLRLNAEINRILTAPDIVARYEKDGGELVPGTPEEFAAFLARNRERWVKVITAGHIRAE
ncbi:MAG TPA: tripartite tricarboxylate transporter substrate binding protein [Alphaproteobacteria bacterium]|nr:tripartite tricarboxylate transporter substrate binding protein [Alphaproteobacteria bacterium]